MSRERTARKRRRRRQLEQIGWREWVALPALGIGLIKAKVDTGARSSALHAVGVRIVDTEAGEVVRFQVHPLQRDTHATVTCEAPLHDRRWIRSSSGHRELRPVIRTTVSLHGSTWPIDLTLTSRDLMGFRMLLGREAVRRRFVVNPGRSYLATPRLPFDEKLRS